MSKAAYIITAIGTPLDASEHLHEEGLKRHLADQWNSGVDGILVAGSMGMMQMLRNDTYLSLVERAAAFSRGRGELLVGVGDTGWARTCDRIEAVSRFIIDGVVVLTPYLFPFTQNQLIEYFTSVADISPVPVYLYDLPALTGLPIDITTYEAVSQHPNIRGAKISGRLDLARELKRRLDDSFRIIVAEPDKVDVLLQEGVTAHLDGMFAIAPHWVMQITQAAMGEDWQLSATFQRKLNALRDLLVAASSDLGAFTALMNAREIPGAFHAAPFGPLDNEEREIMLSSPIVRELVASERTPATMPTEA